MLPFKQHLCFIFNQAERQQIYLEDYRAYAHVMGNLDLQPDTPTATFLFPIFKNLRKKKHEKAHGSRWILGGQHQRQKQAWHWENYFILLLIEIDLDSKKQTKIKYLPLLIFFPGSISCLHSQLHVANAGCGQPIRDPFCSSFLSLSPCYNVGPSHGPQSMNSSNVDPQKLLTRPSQWCALYG